MSAPWWKTRVAYQIYPRSFCDSNGDGIGDLQGILSKLDYLQTLGVGILWLCPVYASPNDDNGYDISDYRTIMADFGTLEDWDALLAGLHDRDIKLVMDLVVNHTSDEHPWFIESRRAEDSAKRDWYFWRPARDGGPPNDWGSIFGGSAWEYDAGSGEYYLHLFSRKQPDLNWENPAVRTAVFDVVRFWLDRGVDGFRMDVINMISKPPGLPDGGLQGVVNGPHWRDYLQAMQQAALRGRNIVTIGETPGVSAELAAEVTAEGSGQLDMVFHFEHVSLDQAPSASKWDYQPLALNELKTVLTHWQNALADRGWNSLYLGNHDQPRAVSRFGNDARYRRESATLLMTLLLTLQGTPFIYQGDEIGMGNVAFAQISDYRDLETLNAYGEMIGRGVSPADALQRVQRKSRDNARTPMQWDDSPNAGFTVGVPWIGVNPDFATINVKQALADPDSILHYTRRLIALRKAREVLALGRYECLMETPETVWAYTRSDGEHRVLVALNFAETEATLDLPAPLTPAQRWMGNYPDFVLDSHRLRLRAYEAVIVALERAPDLT